MCVLHSRLFLAVRDHCPAALLKVSAHLVFGRPVLLLPNLTSHTDVACAHLRWSILATWPPHFHLNCEPLTRCPSCWFSALPQHSSLCCSIQLAVFSVSCSRLVKTCRCKTDFNTLISYNRYVCWQVFTSRKKSMCDSTSYF